MDYRSSCFNVECHNIPVSHQFGQEMTAGLCLWIKAMETMLVVLWYTCVYENHIRFLVNVFKSYTMKYKWNVFPWLPHCTHNFFHSCGCCFFAVDFIIDCKGLLWHYELFSKLVVIVPTDASTHNGLYFALFFGLQICAKVKKNISSIEFCLLSVHYCVLNFYKKSHNSINSHT